MQFFEPKKNPQGDRVRPQFSPNPLRRSLIGVISGLFCRWSMAVLSVVGFPIGITCAAFGQGMPEQHISIGDLPAPGQGSEPTFFEEMMQVDYAESRNMIDENENDGMQRQLDQQCFCHDAPYSNGGCMDNPSESCCEQCGWYAGAAVVFAKPHFKESFQVSSLDLASGTQSLIPFSYDYAATPRVWFGVRSGQSGLRLSYWEFDQDGNSTNNSATPTNFFGAHVVSTIFPANIFAMQPGQQLVANDSLETQIINLHGTIESSFDGMNIVGGVGLRYARLVQSYDATVLNPVLNAVVIPTVASHLEWDRKFNGVGPSVSVDVRKRLGCSSFYGVANGGGALLFGEKTLDRTVLNDQSPQPALPFLRLEKADEVVGIGELGFGLEWCGCTGSGNELRFRGMYEGQLWAESGAPTLGFLGFQGFAVQAELRH